MTCAAGLRLVRVAAAAEHYLMPPWRRGGGVLPQRRSVPLDVEACSFGDIPEDFDIA
jgi:hypothetical protein